MPRMGSKGDGRAAAVTARPLQIRDRLQAREVRNTTTANSVIAATTVSDPTIGAASNEGPSSTTATPAGTESRLRCSQPCTWPAGSSQPPDQAVLQPKQEQRMPPIRFKCACAYANVKFCWIPSVPEHSATTPTNTHIINDPIIR